MLITVGAKIIITGATSDVIRWCRSELVIDNPDFFKKERLGKWTGNTPRTICLFERVGNNIVIPFGMLNEAWKRWGKVAKWVPLFDPISRLNYESNIKPYPYQEKAILRALEAKNGILIMPCGSGKTQSALEIISRLGGKALWLTHTQDLLTQSMNRAKDVLDCDGFGTITGGKVDIGTHITFATVQTMAKIDLSRYASYWDIVVIDECQHCCGSPTRVTQFYKVASSLQARYKYGLTATPHRADGLEKGMYALIGDVIYVVTKEDVKETTCPVHVRMIPTNWCPNLDNVRTWDGTIDYSKMVDDMIHDADRLDLVVNELNSLSGATMVLANRVEYLKEMQARYTGKSVCLSGMGVSKKSRDERKRALQALNNGDIDCIFATYQLAKEGLDVPQLRYVVFATPEKDSTTVIQSAGRVGRKAKGKEYGTVIDFVDEFGMYKKWFATRRVLYRKADIDVVQDLY